MSPHLRDDDIIVSDEESDTETVSPQTDKQRSCSPRPQPRQFSSRSWHECFRRIGRVGARGNLRPSVGQACLVVSGNAHEELGQVGVVRRHTPAMVEMMVRAKSGSQDLLVMKRPSSLILLEAGLVLVQDIDGSVWIRRDVTEL
jgi:hypothetical protein